MIRKLLLLGAICLLTPMLAYGQESAGAGRVEIDSALFGGGALLIPSGGPESVAYVLNAGATLNVNRFVGIEGEIAWAMSRGEALALYGTASPNQRTPSMLFYAPSIVVNPAGHDHLIVPYVEVGAGALSVLNTADTNTFGLALGTTHLTANVGGGARWFPIRHWGLRGDYRYLIIRNDNPPTIAGAIAIRHAQRLYGALVLTF